MFHTQGILEHRYRVDIPFEDLFSDEMTVDRLSERATRASEGGEAGAYLFSTNNRPCETHRSPVHPPVAGTATIAPEGGKLEPTTRPRRAAAAANSRPNSSIFSLFCGCGLCRSKPPTGGGGR
jgi:hypothetical protein